MNSPPRFSLPAPLEGWALALLLAIYLLVGVVGHPPWRGDDLTYLGPIHWMMTHGEWLLPQIAGQPFYDYPPLYYWTGALLGKALGWALPLHDAARLASPLFAGLALYWTGLTARRLSGPHVFAPTILLGMGSLGLVVHAHETQPMLALLAGCALCYAGLARINQQPWPGALEAGLGIGMAGLSAGLPGLGLTLPILFLAPLICPVCRHPRILAALLAALGLGLSLVFCWVAALGVFYPEQQLTWWHRELQDNLPHLTHLLHPSKLLALLGWFAWPVWPIAGWTVWQQRRKLNTPGLLIPLSASVLALLLVATTGSIRPASTLPILPPLVLLAAHGVGSLRRGAANAFDWFGLVTFTVFTLVIWAGWSALYFGWPPGLGRQLMKLAPHFPRIPQASTIALGAGLSLAILVLPTLTRRTPNRASTNWALGATLLWCLAVCLWQPWFAHTKNYQPIAQALAEKIAQGPSGCVAGAGLGDTQKAGLAYFSGVMTKEFTKDSDCPLVLVYGSGSNTQIVAGGWDMIWERRLGGGRRSETFRLYRRD
jgi:4-amino-4-deoxy-L-arabinose transferase-like glycosyltransferase